MKINEVVRIVDIYDSLIQKCQRGMEMDKDNLLKWYMCLERKNLLWIKKLEFIRQANKERIYVV